MSRLKGGISLQQKLTGLLLWNKTTGLLNGKLHLFDIEQK